MIFREKITFSIQQSESIPRISYLIHLVRNPK